MAEFVLETMGPADWIEVAALIYDSTNGWYQANRKHLIFTGPPQSTKLFCDVYEQLDPGCCLIARSTREPRIIGCSFYHPRPTHVSLGIMNVHPLAFGQGVAKAMLAEVIRLATARNLPIRLVSSAMNLDSFSLYTKAGFVPRQLYQDMILEIPTSGFGLDSPTISRIRPATLDDVPAMGQVEEQVANIRREKDYRFFVENRSGVWQASVLDGPHGIRGWCVSIAHPASNMIGPCVAEDQSAAIELLRHAINQRRGQTMVFLVPVDRTRIVQAAYQWGARNCEMHVLQVRGPFHPIQGVSIPTFMPETA